MPSKLTKRKNPYDMRRWHPREIINARLEALGKTKYWLVGQAGSSEAVVYRFLSGQAETSAENAQQMLAAVGLELRPIAGFDPDASSG